MLLPKRAVRQRQRIKRIAGQPFYFLAVVATCQQLGTKTCRDYGTLPLSSSSRRPRVERARSILAVAPPTQRTPSARLLVLLGGSVSPLPASRLRLARSRHVSRASSHPQKEGTVPVLLRPGKRKGRTDGGVAFRSSRGRSLGGGPKATRPRASGAYRWAYRGGRRTLRRDEGKASTAPAGLAPLNS